MIFIYALVYFYYILGNKQIEAGIFDPLTNIFAPQQNDNNIPGKVINTFLSPFRDDTNDVQSPDEVNHNEARNRENLKAWWNTESTSSLPMIRNIFNDHSTTPDYDKIVAEKFPAAVNLLQKLKEMNKLKEQQKQQQESSGINQTPKPSFGNKQTPKPGFGNKQTPKPDFGDQTKKPEDKDKEVTKTTTEKPKTEGVKGMKSITKRHFYFQVQPLKPRGEENRSTETVYYEDD